MVETERGSDDGDFTIFSFVICICIVCMVIRVRREPYTRINSSPRGTATHD